MEIEDPNKEKVIQSQSALIQTLKEQVSDLLKQTFIFKYFSVVGKHQPYADSPRRDKEEG